MAIFIVIYFIKPFIGNGGSGKHPDAKLGSGSIIQGANHRDLSRPYTYIATVLGETGLCFAAAL